jgi:hypothetical protein
LSMCSAAAQPAIIGAVVVTYDSGGVGVSFKSWSSGKSS